VDGRAPRGPRRAVGGTRQSARGTWAVAGRAEVGSGGPGARQFAGCALGEVLFGPADWPGGLGAGEGAGAAPPRQDFGHLQTGQLVDPFLDTPGSLDTPELASWRDSVLDTP
jgi:hypothetical protein